jgi:hypothetical protein
MYIARILLGKIYYITIFSEGGGYFIAIFPGGGVGGVAREKGYYTTPVSIFSPAIVAAKS